MVHYDRMLFKASVAEHLIENYFTDSPEYILHQVCICCCCLETVNISVWKPVFTKKLSLDECPREYFFNNI